MARQGGMAATVGSMGSRVDRWGNRSWRREEHLRRRREDRGTLQCTRPGSVSPAAPGSVSSALVRGKYQFPRGRRNAVRRRTLEAESRQPPWRQEEKRSDSVGSLNRSTQADRTHVRRNSTSDQLSNRIFHSA